MNERQKHLFPISIFHSSVANNKKIKDLLVPRIEQYKKQLNSPPNAWITTKIITSFDNEEINSIFHEEEISKEIESQYKQVFEEFFDKKWDISIGSMWFNYYENGEYQEPHTHLGDWSNTIHFACVHFLSFDPLVHNKLSFIDPIRRLRSHFLEFDSNKYSQVYELNANEGDIVMFPAYLEHFVKSSSPTPGNPRITISFNVRILKYGDNIYHDMSK